MYDHEETLVGESVEFSGSWDGDDFLREVLHILRDAMVGTKPSAYNQNLLADLASENIKEGVPRA
ncbi:hypothetical protein ACERIM_16635 [Natrinema sp. H-ect1]|uniref:hypothetical protein n=1 Tax=Natrinema sp. H-ect1 TaxID=3242700 RepID=UPI00359EAFB0